MVGESHDFYLQLLLATWLIKRGEPPLELGVHVFGIILEFIR